MDDLIETSTFFKCTFSCQILIKPIKIALGNDPLGDGFDGLHNGLNL
jgi:hypothetical protein